MQRERDNVRVAHTGCSFRNIEHIMTPPTQKCYQRRRDAFVREPTHVSTVDDIFVGQIIGSECLRGTDIIECQPRVIHKDRLGRHTRP